MTFFQASLEGAITLVPGPGDDQIDPALDRNLGKTGPTSPAVVCHAALEVLSPAYVMLRVLHRPG